MDWGAVLAVVVVVVLILGSAILSAQETGA